MNPVDPGSWPEPPPPINMTLESSFGVYHGLDGGNHREVGLGVDETGQGCAQSGVCADSWWIFKQHGRETGSYLEERVRDFWQEP
jgi:hypothetical protein